MSILLRFLSFVWRFPATYLREISITNGRRAHPWRGSSLEQRRVLLRDPPLAWLSFWRVPVQLRLSESIHRSIRTKSGNETFLALRPEEGDEAHCNRLLLACVLIGQLVEVILVG